MDNEFVSFNQDDLTCFVKQNGEDYIFTYYLEDKDGILNIANYKISYELYCILVITYGEIFNSTLPFIKEKILSEVI